MTRSISADFWLLLNGRLRRLQGAKRDAGRAGLIRLILVLIGSAMFTGGLYAGSYKFLYWIISRTDYVGGLLTSVLLDYLMLISLGILLLSSFIAALAEVLLSDDLSLLRAAPLREEALFLDRLVMIWVQTAWMPLAFVVPILLGFARAWGRLIAETPGTGSAPDFWALTWLIAFGLPALTLLPAAFSCLSSIVIGRFVSAARLRNTMLIGAIVGGMGLYGASQYLRLDRLLSPQGVDNFIESVRSMERSKTPWLPTDWLAQNLDLALHGDLSAQGFYQDRGLAEQRTEQLLEKALKASGDRPWLRLGLESVIYGRKRNSEPGVLDTLRNLSAKLPFFNMRPPPQKAALWPPFGLLALGGLIIALGMLLARSSYALAYGRSQTGQSQQQGQEGRRKLTRFLNKILPKDVAPFIVKDALVFSRDANQWTQALVIAGMIALSAWGFAAAADRSDLGELAKVLPYATVVLFGVGAWIGTLLTSAASARLVFPLVSLEGEAFWIVRAAPVSMKRLLKAKITLALLPTLLLGTSIAWVVCSALRFTPELTTLALIMALANAVVTCCLGIGMGAAMPDFRFVNVSQLVQGPGGIVFIVLSMTYATLLTGFCAAYVYAEARHTLTPLRGLLMLGAPLLIGLLMAAAALTVGLKRLQRLER
ncbi:MAG: hypothetical protein OSB21_07895 [Myxococcota bacterium]|nr:hypothetical protein [Myxococcota bacterium]